MTMFAFTGCGSDTIDLNKYVSIETSGASPKINFNIVVDKSQPELNDISFTTNAVSGHVKNGDKITVTAAISGFEEAFAKKYNKGLSVREKEYIVDYDEKYLTDISQLSFELYNSIDNELKTKMKNDFESWNNEDLVSMELLGTYVTVAKPNAKFATSYNNIYFVYKITAKNDKSNGNFDFYWYGKYMNITINNDGNCNLIVSNYDAINPLHSDNVIKVDKYIYPGFKDLNSLYNVLINNENYDYTSTIQ